DPHGFRSPSYSFSPTQDCVKGTVLASVTFIDHKGKAHTINTTTYTVRAVCDLLTPAIISADDFDSMLSGFEHGEITLRVQEWTPEEMHSKSLMILKHANFFEVSSIESTIGNHIEYRVQGWARGKYTEKQVGVEITINGIPDKAGSTIRIVVSGEDEAMILPAIDEMSKKISAWICPRCGGKISSSMIEELKRGKCMDCTFCGVSLDIGR
ncbi:MAG: hypothetical protein ACTSQZ_09955, partial [Candidatus Thorarchaeota archaeon]